MTTSHRSGANPDGATSAVAPGGRAHRRARNGVESNARLTGATAAVLLVLLAIEGVTVLRVRSLLTAHVFVGMLLVPPVIVKIAATIWRFARYYQGSPAYREKGPPPAVLRLLGPFVILLTVVVFGSGIAVFIGPHSLRQSFLLVHKASFVLWFIATAIHVLGHILETARLAPLDLMRRTRSQVKGAGARQTALVASLVVGVGLGLLLVGHVGTYLGR